MKQKARRGACGSAAPGERPAGRSSGVRMGRGARAAGLAVVLLLSAAAVAPLVPRGVNPYDEGLLAYGAERVLHGRHPAVHFYSPYGPGVFYVVAAAYRLFGTRLLVERWVAGLLLILVGGLAYALLMERWAGGAEVVCAAAPERPAPAAERVELRHLAISAITGVLITAMLLGAWWYPPVNSGALALLLLSGLALQRGLRTGAVRWAAAAGLFTGGALLWRLTFGGALLAANMLTWALLAGDPPGARRRPARGLAALVGAATLVALPVYALLLGRGGQRAVQSLLIWPYVSTGAADLSWPAFSRDPPPGQDSVLAVVAALTHGAGFYYGVAALALVAWRLRLRGLAREDQRLGFWLLLLLPALFLYANGRTDYVHVTPLLTFSLLLGALAVDSGLAGVPAGPRRRWQEIGLLVWSGSLLLLLPTALFSWHHNWRRVGAAPVELPGPRGAGVYAAPHYGRQYRRLLPQLRRCVAPDQALFSGTLRHDLFLTNDNLLYFLAERRAATYFWCLDAGVTTTAPVQRRMIREIARNDTGAAILWLMPGAGEANAGGRSSGVHLLDHWLRRHFEPQWNHRSLYLLAVPRKTPVNLLGRSDDG